MHLTSWYLLGLSLVCADSLVDDAPMYAPMHGVEIITRDVAVIGGGSAGTYAAVRLQDYNHSVVLIEQKNVLGGATSTFKDLKTGGTIELGVIAFHDLPVVRNYFDRFDISLIKSNIESLSVATSSVLVDFATGKTISRPPPQNPAHAFEVYLEQLAKYPFLTTGFDLPNPVPEDLLMPFGQFVEKHNLQAMVWMVYAYSEAYSRVLDLPTLYIVKYITADVIKSLRDGFLTTRDRNNHVLYDAAAELLRDNVLLNANITKMKRDASDYAHIEVATLSGVNHIRAKKIVFAIPPHVDSLPFFDFDEEERDLFSQFWHCGYYTGLLRNSGLPAHLTITNVGIDNATYGIPILPSSHAFEPTVVQNLVSVRYAFPNTHGHTPSVEDVKHAIRTELDHLKNSGIYVNENVEFEILLDHSPHILNVPAAAMEKGFYTKLNRLQGQRRTWYTGAAWETHDSSMIWNFTESLLPRILREE